MKIVVLHNQPLENASVEEQDVLVQRDAVVAALNRLGHQSYCLGCTLDLETARRQLQELRPDVVFNLVESLGGTDRLMPLATLLLDALAIPYTGAQTDTILATSNKLAAKERLCGAGLPTPTWIVDVHGAKEVTIRGCDCASASHDKWIVKPVWEHASIGMDDRAVVATSDHLALAARLGDYQQNHCRPYFAEQFIDGREFNLSLLAGQLLPPAEIDFSSFPPDKPRIVGQDAKWEPGSFEYEQTPRCFDFSSGDAPLLEQLEHLAHRCWSLFGVHGYARVDFRVDRAGQAWILEVNANPCLSPDAGFAAALERAEIRYDDAVQQIINDTGCGLTP